MFYEELHGKALIKIVNEYIAKACDQKDFVTTCLFFGSKIISKNMKLRRVKNNLI